jgi:hypothetical protein
MVAHEIHILGAIKLEGHTTLAKGQPDSIGMLSAHHFHNSIVPLDHLYDGRSLQLTAFRPTFVSRDSLPHPLYGSPLFGLFAIVPNVQLLQETSQSCWAKDKVIALTAKLENELSIEPVPTGQERGVWYGWCYGIK